MTEIVVHKERTNTLLIKLQYDVSQDFLTSDIRKAADSSSQLIAQWDVRFATDGKDGKLILTLDDTITSEIIEYEGYMDLKRISGGEPLTVFNDPIKVRFQNVVTE